MLRVAVVGGGPSGSCAAEILAKAGIQTWLFERKLDNAKPCGGAIPLCMVEEFDLPDDIIDRKVRNMKMISPSNREVDIKLDPLGYDDNAFIGMCRREVFDAYLRNRAADLGTTLVNGLVQKIDTGNNRKGPYTLHYAYYSGGGPTGEAKTLEVDLIIGADGANSRVAKAMDAGDYNVAIAFQERIKLPAEEMTYYEDLAEMYVGTDVSPDFYAWVFPSTTTWPWNGNHAAEPEPDQGSAEGHPGAGQQAPVQRRSDQSGSPPHPRAPSPQARGGTHGPRR